MEYHIKDIELAPAGRKKIEWVRREMSVLSGIAEQWKKEKPLDGVLIAACLHVTSETAVLMITLKEGGAKVALCASNPLSTQDEVAASLVKDFGINVYAICGEDRETYYQHIDKVLETSPQITMDDGADLVSTLHQKGGSRISQVIGGTEETTTGVVRLKSMAKAGQLRYPVIAVNDADTKHLFDNRYGTGQSTLEGILRATTFLVLRLGQMGHKMPLEIMLLAGVAIGFFFSALISLGMFLAGENLHQMVFWIMGGFWNSSWNKVYTLLPFFLIGFPIIFSYSRELNTFLLGEKVAESMGVEVEKTKKILLIVTSLLVAASVSVSGVIGFVGLVVPHIIRIIIGEDHRQLLPASLFLGSSVLLWADIFSRTLLHPVELPVGVLTSLMGAPFFIYLLRRKKKGW
jgi:ABC-type Mn2+/Zn2+ transport system permease subunit